MTPQVILKKMEPPEQKINFDSQKLTIYDNSGVKTILVGEDTLDIKLRDFEDSIKKRGNIFADLGLIIAFLATLVTVSEFKDFMTVRGFVWQAVFIFCLIASIIKLVRDIFFNFRRTVQRGDIITNLLDETKKKNL